MRRRNLTFKMLSKANMNRNLNFDLIRSLAIFFVICIHSMGYFNELHVQGLSNIFDWGFHMWNVLISSAVPLFVMLSGALLLNGKVTPPFLFLQHRLHRVLIPFTIWSVILFLLSMFKEHWVLDWLLVPKFFGLYLTTGVVGIYWFVYLILGLYLITPILKPYFVQASKSSLFYVTFILVAFMVVKCAWEDVRWVKCFSFDYFCYVAYFIIGYVAFKAVSKARIVKCSVLLMLMLSFVGQLILDRYELKQFFPFQFFFNTSLFYVLLLPKIRSYGYFANFVTFVSKASYGIYLSHVVVISALCMVGFERSLPLPIEPILMAILVLLIEIMVIKIIKTVNLEKWLC